MLAPRKALLALAGCVALMVLFAQAYGWSNAFYTKRAQDSGRLTLALVVEAVDPAIGRYAALPRLIAEDPVFRTLLTQKAGQAFYPFENEKLRQIALSIGASDVYVIDTTGMTVAASNYREETPFLGQNFAYRPYFSQALAGKAAIFHALGTTSGERGFFFSAPILDGIEVVGVLAVKITVGELEQDWQGLGHDILIADENGIVFLTSREDYKYRALAPLTDATRERILRTQQFPLDMVTPLDLAADVIAPQTVQVTVTRNAGRDAYLATSTPLEFAGWHAIVLTPMGPINGQVLRAMLFGILTFAVALLAALVIWQRRANILERVRIEQEQRALLEVKVRERTADLDAANASLRDEVAMRKATEDRLRKSQKELVQAGKLAALGKMSAAISHEINQPLAIIKSYADNAVQFLQRARIDEARTNIDGISKMSDRMTEISAHLRNFARQPGDTLKPIDVADVIRETMGLVGPQLRANGAEIQFTSAPQATLALGGRLRLQQVLVNIITNALEAMAGQADPVIEIATREKEGCVEITLRDHGPGLPQEDLEQVFDAFYTTKEAGVGMGLGMSISQNIISDFGGTLEAGNHPDGGAVFEIRLQNHVETAALDQAV